MTDSPAYIGRISRVLKQYAWIDAKTVTRADGTPPEPPITHDIFLHKNNVRDSPLGWPDYKGLEMRFSVEPDERRGEGHFRAVYALESAASRVRRVQQGGIELVVQAHGDGNVLDHSSPFVSWCVSPALAGKVKLLALGGDTLRLLLIWWPVGRGKWNTEQRRLVKLSDPMAMLPFSASGQNRLMAFIVAGLDEQQLRDKYLRDGPLVMRGFVEVRSDDSVNPRFDAYIGSGCVDLEMPEGLFAPKRADEKWVNMLHKYPPRDECEYRQRQGLAYTVKPFIFVLIGILLGLSMLVRALFALGFLSFGIKGLSFAPVFDLRKRMTDTLPDSSWFESYFVPHIKGIRIIFPIALSPGALLFWAFGAWLGSGTEFSWLVLFIGGVVAFAGIMAIATICDITYQLVRRWMRAEPSPSAAQRLRDKKVAEINGLICEVTSPARPDAFSLPIEPRNIRFFAAAIKQKVCRAFSIA